MNKNIYVPIEEQGCEVWKLNDKGQLHREDGPAVEAGGNKQWFFNGKLHRIDGPAIELTDGTKIWYIEGKLHRLDGPVYEDVYGRKEWSIQGTFINRVDYFISCFIAIDL